MKPEPIKITTPSSTIDNLNLFNSVPSLNTIKENTIKENTIKLDSFPEPEPEPVMKGLVGEVKENKPDKNVIVNISNDNDIDETSSLANFFDDVKSIVETKGIKVDKSSNYILFDDAPTVDPNATVKMS